MRYVLLKIFIQVCSSFRCLKMYYLILLRIAAGDIMSFYTARELKSYPASGRVPSERLKRVP
jgi:hypothetical protein